MHLTFLQQIDFFNVIINVGRPIKNCHIYSVPGRISWMMFDGGVAQLVPQRCPIVFNG